MIVGQWKLENSSGVYEAELNKAPKFPPTSPPIIAIFPITLVTQPFQLSIRKFMPVLKTHIATNPPKSVNAKLLGWKAFELRSEVYLCTIEVIVNRTISELPEIVIRSIQFMYGWFVVNGLSSECFFTRHTKKFLTGLCLILFLKACVCSVLNYMSSSVGCCFMFTFDWETESSKYF